MMLVGRRRRAGNRSIHLAKPLPEHEREALERAKDQIVNALNWEASMGVPERISTFIHTDDTSAVGASLVLEWATEFDGAQALVWIHRSSPMPFTARDIELARLANVLSDDQAVRRRSHFGLSRRMSQVLDALERGLSEKECARELMISRHTVHCHIKALYRKLNLSSRGELLTYCLHHCAAVGLDCDAASVGNARRSSSGV